MEIEKSTPLILKFTLSEDEVAKLFSYQPVDAPSSGGTSIRLQVVQTAPPPLAHPVGAPANAAPPGARQGPQTASGLRSEIEARGSAAYKGFHLEKIHLSYKVVWYTGDDFHRLKALVGKTGCVEDLMRLIDDHAGG